MTRPIRDRLSALFAPLPAFDARFTAPGRFPGVLYLAPALAAPFRALTAAMARAFPDHPPYGGAFDGTVPHLTIAQEPDPPVSDMSMPARPLTAGSVAVSHLALRGGRWYEFARYPIAASGDRR